MNLRVVVDLSHSSPVFSQGLEPGQGKDRRVQAKQPL